MAALDFEAYWNAAFTWDDYLNREVQQHAELWKGVWQKSRASAEAVERIAGAADGWKLLVISEDWCGDASNTVPVIARLAEAVPGLEMRVVKRDENLELMDEFLTNGSRSIPLAVVLRPDWSVAGRWGPRPTELQDFVLREKKEAARPMDAVYRDVRTW